MSLDIDNMFSIYITNILHSIFIVSMETAVLYFYIYKCIVLYIHRFRVRLHGRLAQSLRASYYNANVVSSTPPLVKLLFGPFVFSRIQLLFVRVTCLVFFLGGGNFPLFLIYLNLSTLHRFFLSSIPLSNKI